MEKHFRKRIIGLFPVVIFSVIMVSLSVGPIKTQVQAASKNNVQTTVLNSGFETGDLSNWTMTGTVAAQSSDQESGSYSALLSAKSSTLVQTVTGIAQGSYTLSAWIKGDTSSNSAYMLATDTGAPDAKLLIDTHISSTEWTQVALRNVLIYNGQCTITFASGSGTNLAVDDVQLTLDSNDNNPVTNWNFESGNLKGWTVSHGMVGITTDADTGSHAVVLSANAQISQVINVSPNTFYIAAVRAKVDREDVTETVYQKSNLGDTGQLVNVVTYGDRVNLGVKDMSGTVLRQAPDATSGYSLLTVAFKTGPSDRQVTLYANTLHDTNYQNSVKTYNSANNASHDEWPGNGADKAYVDNFDVFTLDNTVVKGSDVSFLPLIEDKGGKYFANGVQQDCLTILSNHGVNAITNMIFVHAGNQIYNQSTPKELKISTLTDSAGNTIEVPTTMQAGYFDKIHSLKLAQRAKDLDMGYFPSFHLSDYWTSASKQYTSLDWMSEDSDGNYVDWTTDQITTTLYNHVFDVMKSLKNQGTPPMAVKIGNEENSGIVWSTGKSLSSTGFRALFNAAYDAIHAVFPGVSGFYHTNNGYSTSTSESTVSTLQSNEVKFDGMAYSLYGGRASSNIMTMITNNIANHPELDYLNPETGFTFTSYTPDFSNTDSSLYQSQYYKMSPNGQYNYLLNYMQAYRDVPNPNARMRGFFYWETDWIVVEGAGYTSINGNDVDRRIMFNNGDTSVVSMGSSSAGKMGDMLESMYAYLWRGLAKNKAATMLTPLEGYGTYTITQTHPTGVLFDSSSLSLTAGEHQRLFPTITPADGIYNWNLKWTSDAPKIATVDSLGNVIALSPGTARITVMTVDGGYTATCTVTVEAATVVGAGNLTLTVDDTECVNGSTSNATVGDELILKATLPSDVSNNVVKFTSSNPKVAVFLGEYWQSSDPGTLYQQTDKTENVQLNVIGNGLTTITATSADGTAKISFKLNVVEQAQ